MRSDLEIIISAFDFLEFEDSTLWASFMLDLFESSTGELLSHSNPYLFIPSPHSGRSFLHFAALTNNSHLCELLIDLGFDPNLPAEIECQYATPLHFAASGGHLNSVSCLYAHGALPDSMADDLSSPLHWAAAENQIGSICLLFEIGASLNHRDHLYLSPLDWAIERKHQASINKLTSLGAVASKFPQS